jgi:hypothetical protein
MPFPQVVDVSLNTLVATTMQNYQPEMITNVITSVPTVKFLMEENGQYTMGGTRINVQLLYGFNTTTTYYNYSDYIDVSPQEAVTAAQYKFANLTGAITIFGEEEAANAGDPKIQDLAQAKIEQTELSLVRQLNQSVFGDSTGFFGAAPDGLANLVYLTTVPANPPSGNVGGIDATAFPFWRNPASIPGVTYIVGGAMGTTAPDYHLRMFNLTTDGNLRPNFIVSDSATWESYNINGASHYQMRNTDQLDLGYEHINYKGVPWVWDRDCPAKYQYFLNSRFLYAKIDSNRFFKPTNWMDTISQDGKVMRIHLRFNFVCSNRMLQGVVNWA